MNLIMVQLLVDSIIRPIRDHRWSANKSPMITWARIDKSPKDAVALPMNQCAHQSSREFVALLQTSYASVTSERTETVACKGFEPLPLACAKCCNYLCLKALHRILRGLFTAFSTMAVACV